MTLDIRPMADSDADAVLGIYGQGIATGHATFESEAPSWSAFDASHLDACRLVAEDDGNIVGWAALSPVSSRCVYGGVAEVSVYVGLDATGRGVGAALLAALIEASEAENIWTLQAGIFPENMASITAHRNAGFRVVGTRERLGLMRHGPLTGVWRDVVLLERRRPHD